MALPHVLTLDRLSLRYAHLASDHLKATVERLDFSMNAEEKQEGSAG